MSVTVYEMAHSPYCIPITAALRACGVKFSTREIPNWDRSELLRLTGGAYYQVPVLEHDGRFVFESGADTLDVARYADAHFAAGRLFPEHLEGLQAIVVEHIENEIEARTFKLVDIHYVPTIADVAHRGMVVRHKERRFGRGCLTQWTANATQIRAEADALLARFETTLRHSPFIFGDTPVYADFALVGILGNLTFCDWNQLSAEQSALTAWRERLAGWTY
jgi:glutathione S-transferase